MTEANGTFDLFHASAYFEKNILNVTHLSLYLPPSLLLQLSDLQADSEEVQRTAQQLKKKCQRLTAELQDTKLHLEGQQSRNHDLEKKQRK